LWFLLHHAVTRWLFLACVNLVCRFLVVLYVLLVPVFYMLMAACLAGVVCISVMLAIVVMAAMCQLYELIKDR